MTKRKHNKDGSTVYNRTQRAIRRYLQSIVGVAANRSNGLTATTDEMIRAAFSLRGLPVPTKLPHEKSRGFHARCAVELGFRLDPADVLKVTKPRRKRDQRRTAFMETPITTSPGARFEEPEIAFDDPRLKEFYASWEWKRLRYATLRKLGTRCLCCGASADNGAKIVVDHIKPIRRNWSRRLDPDNVQVLCDDCNMGKGSRDETDFRYSDASALGDGQVLWTDEGLVH